MRLFKTWREIQDATAPDAPHEPCGFVCSHCKGEFPLPGTGYAIERDTDALICYPCGDEKQREELKLRRTFACYLSNDETRVTTWPGGELGKVVRRSHSRTGFGHTMLTHVQVRDVHGAMWYGKGAGGGMCITLRPMKG